MEKDIVIKVKNLTKLYPLRSSKRDKEGKEITYHTALENINFEVKKGESVGIVGPNGSGKSTLLKILAGVSKPTTGQVKIRGKVASILDIGAGFHPELSGRENVYLNGQIHGFSRKEISKQFDAIVAFSGIEDFIDEPVKNYSNGMYLRLAFSIMAHLDFDIYLFDEVLSVGDAEFRRKCKECISLFKNKGKTLLLVSHQLNDLESCSTYFLISKADLNIYKSWDALLFDYFEKDDIKVDILPVSQNIEINSFENNKHSSLRLISFSIFQESEFLVTNKEIKFSIKFEKLIIGETIDLLLEVKDENGLDVFAASPMAKGVFSSNINKGIFVCNFTLPAYVLYNTIYSVQLLFFKNLQARRKMKVENSINTAISFTKVCSFKPKIVMEESITSVNSLFFQQKLILGDGWEVLEA